MLTTSVSPNAPMKKAFLGGPREGLTVTVLGAILGSGPSRALKRIDGFRFGIAKRQAEGHTDSGARYACGQPR